MIPGPRNALTDVAGLRVGHAEDAALKSGVTVVTADRPFRASVDLRGGAPGTRELGLLAPEQTVAAVDALVLAGGSAFGLDAAAGVVAALRQAGRGFAVGPHRIPIVPAAILFDLTNGGDKAWTHSPYPALGAAALAAAGQTCAFGTVGAGVGAVAGRLKGGLGTASTRLESGETVAALVAVNAVGSVIAPQQRRFWAGAFEIGDEFGGLGPPKGPVAAVTMGDTKFGAEPGTNTTLGVVATDAALDKAGLRRLAIAAQSGLARSIVPAQTEMDGDLVFAVSTAEMPAPIPADRAMALGHAAATAMSRAIARGVFAAEPRKGDRVPCWSDLPDRGLPGRDGAA